MHTKGAQAMSFHDLNHMLWTAPLSFSPPKLFTWLISHGHPPQVQMLKTHMLLRIHAERDSKCLVSTRDF